MSFSLSTQAIGFKANVANAAPLRATAPPAKFAAARMPLIEARVAIRFTRQGRNKMPFYRLVAIDSAKRREGKPLEYLGYYNPMTKETQLNAPSIKKWIANGAKPSDSVESLLKKAMII